jgi:hypothetical protein
MEVSAVNTNQDQDQFLVDRFSINSWERVKKKKCQDLYIDIYNLIC